MRYSTKALGAAIRAHREAHEPPMTQEDLGMAAGYGAGAGVSISRVERGMTRPGPQRLTEIASALGLTLEQLEADASRRQGRAADGDNKQPGSSKARGSGRAPVKERLNRLQDVIDERTARITTLGDAFNAAHAAARDRFFLKFVELADQIMDAPTPPRPDALVDDGEYEATASAEAEFRLGIARAGVAEALLGGAGGAAAGAAAGGAAAYATFTAASMLGTASTGAAISGLSGVAATNATLAFLGGGSLAAGGAGIAGGTLLLTGIVAAPAAILAVGGLLWMTRRNQKQEAAVHDKLDQVDAEIAETQPGFDNLTQALTRATEILDYTSVHGAHALKRWLAGLPTTRPVAWEEMTPAQQQRYHDFIAIAGCQVTVANLNFGEHLTARDEQLAHLVRVTDELLTQAMETIETLV